MRKLASIQKISNVRPIEGADKIEVVDVLGWSVVVEKGKFQVGDLCVYFEVDSWLDATNPAFASFEDRFVNWGSKRGMRLKTIKPRKQISQGLVLALESFPQLEVVEEGLDVTEFLGIEKWESETERTSNGSNSPTASKTRAFPWFIRKTDQERVQNYTNELGKHLDETFEKTIKLDGSSMTVYVVTNKSPLWKEIISEYEKRETKKLSASGKVIRKIKKFFGLIKQPEYITGLCSRNIELDINDDNHFSQFVKQERILEEIAACRHLFGSFAVQGELVGPSIQQNYEKVDSLQYYVYDVFDIDKQEYKLPVMTRTITCAAGLSYVPILEEAATLDAEASPRERVYAILEDAEGPGMNNGVKREGVVWKSNRTGFSFKAISNSYLLKKNELD